MPSFLAFAKKTKVIWWLIGAVVVFGAAVVFLLKRVATLNRRLALSMQLGKAQMEYTRWLSKSSTQTAAKNKKAQRAFNQTQAKLEEKRDRIRRADENGNAALASEVNRFFR